MVEVIRKGYITEKSWWGVFCRTDGCELSIEPELKVLSPRRTETADLRDIERRVGDKLITWDNNDSGCDLAEWILRQAGEYDAEKHGSEGRVVVFRTNLGLVELLFEVAARESLSGLEGN